MVQIIQDNKIYRIYNSMYQNGFRITENTGNNSFSYNIRKQQNSEPKIYVTNLIEGTIDDVHVGDKIVFEEINSKGEIQSFFGLKNFIKIFYSTKNGTELDLIPSYIFDNHNHALFFRYKELYNGTFNKPIKLIHIDQHTDMNNNSNYIINNPELKDIFYFTNNKCDVGNFIKPAIQSGFISEVLEINTEYSLLNYFSNCEDGNNKARLNKEKNITNISKYDNYILDIDLDFRHPQMGIEQYNKTIEITKNLVSKAKLLTISTSPYFIDQILAIKILKDILE